MSAVQPLAFKLNRDPTKSGHYNFFTDSTLGWIGKTLGTLTATGKLTPAIFAITADANAPITLSSPGGLTLSDGHGHTATFLINTYYSATTDFSSLSYLNDVQGNNDGQPLAANLNVGSDGKYYVAVAPRYLSFDQDATGADWAGTVPLTVDYQ